MTKFYIGPGGAYVGGFDGAPPPENSFEVPLPPARASDVWDGLGWKSSKPGATARAQIIAALDALDAKSIRPLREGDAARVAEIEAQAAALRAQLSEV